jgi:hypothetical protein
VEALFDCAKALFDLAEALLEMTHTSKTAKPFFYKKAAFSIKMAAFKIISFNTLITLHF